jgi:hypothetical protein
MDKHNFSLLSSLLNICFFSLFNFHPLGGSIKCLCLICMILPTAKELAILVDFANGNTIGSVMMFPLLSNLVY